MSFAFEASELASKQEQLLQWFAPWRSCAVAFSGGVDSVVVAKAAHVALGTKAIAVIGVSPSLASGELQIARQAAAEIGIPLRELSTQEFSNPQYRQNHSDRCYHCKTQLYSQIRELAPQLDVQVILNGANADDLGDYRPGLQAARDLEVRSPLIECGITKQEVRQLAKEWQLSVHDKPATPCLSSRVAYGEEVNPKRLAMIDQAEQFLRSQGLGNVRVRYHRNDLARLEVALADLPRLCDSPLREQLIHRLREIGFRYITVDLEGFRSGSFNQLVSLPVLDAD